jgi:hypothetical protein
MSNLFFLPPTTSLTTFHSTRWPVLPHPVPWIHAVPQTEPVSSMSPRTTSLKENQQTRYTRIEFGAYLRDLVCTLRVYNLFTCCSESSCLTCLHCQNMPSPKAVTQCMVVPSPSMTLRSRICTRLSETLAWVYSVCLVIVGNRAPGHRLIANGTVPTSLQVSDGWLYSNKMLIASMFRRRSIPCWGSQSSMFHGNLRWSTATLPCQSRAQAWSRLHACVIMTKCTPFTLYFF